MQASPAAVAPLVQALSTAGIDAVVLKGNAFAAQVHGDPAARDSLDIDLLVRPRDRHRAVATLQALGYEERQRSNGLIREIHLVHRQRACVDLHWNPVGGEMAFPFDFDDLWAERRLVRMPGGDVPVPGPPWLVVLTAFNLVRELPEVERRYLDDLSAILDRFPDLDWQATARIARATRTRLLTAIALHAIARLAPRTLPAAAVEAFPLDARAQRELDRVVAQLTLAGDVPRTEFVTEIKAMLGHHRYREAWRDRLRPFLLFPLVLLLPDDKDADRARLSGRPLWRERLARVPEVVGALRREAEQRRTDRRFVACLGRPSTVLTPAGDVSLHLVGDDGVLFAAERQAVFGLNTAAAWVWCQLETAEPLRAIQTAYAQTFRVDEATAAATIDDLARDWWRHGLLEGAPRPAAPLPPAETQAAGSRAAATPAFPQPARAGALRHYRLLECTVAVTLPDQAIAARVDSLLGHLASEGAPDIRLVVEAVPDAGYLIRRDGHMVEQAPLLAGLAPQVKSAVLVAAINATRFTAFLHAAMLRRRGAAILLPAAPGSGKTCLAAALAKRGFAYHTDEVTLLIGPELEARGVPLALTVKEPAWPVLGPLYPELAALDSHARIDGKICRYLPPPVAHRDPDLDRAWPVAALVFPRYDASGPTRLEPLRPIDALERTLGECLAIQSGLDAEAVQRLADWIETCPAYSLTFDSLDKASGAITAALDGALETATPA